MELDDRRQYRDDVLVVAPGGGVTGNRTLTNYGAIATAHKFTAGVWVISGNGIT